VLIMLYLPDLACDFFLFPRFHLPMKGKRYSTVEDVQMITAVITTLNSISKTDIKQFNDLRGDIHVNRNF